MMSPEQREACVREMLEAFECINNDATRKDMRAALDVAEKAIRENMLAEVQDVPPGCVVRGYGPADPKCPKCRGVGTIDESSGSWAACSCRYRVVERLASSPPPVVRPEETALEAQPCGRMYYRRKHFGPCRAGDGCKRVPCDLASGHRGECGPAQRSTKGNGGGR